MLKTLRAFAWIRWRVFVNSLERTSARDTVERFSLAIQQIGPIIALALLVPSAASLAALGAYAGYWLPSEPRVFTFESIRFLLHAAFGFSLIAPILLPSLEHASAVRLLLLPIPRRTLYLAQAASGIAEPWILLAIPAMGGVAVGLAAGGAIGAALITLVAGLLLLVVLIGLSALATFVTQLIFRNRRRGELIALIFIIVIPAAGMLPGLLGAQRDREDREAVQTTRAEREARGEATWSDRTSHAAGTVASVLPAELFATATRESAHDNPRAALAPLAGLAATALLLHGASLFVFGRLLDAPPSSSRRQASGAAEEKTIAVPGLSRGSAAVALAQVRLALRTPRGRAILLSPLLMFVVFLVLMRHGGGTANLGAIHLTSGLSLAAMGSGIYLLSILPFAMNQFAIDRAGLTLALLSPLSTRELLLGKAVGHGLLLAGPIALCMLIAYILFPGGDPALWLSLPPAIAATYLLAAPGAAVLSAIFPRAVNLNSIGRGSNAHGAAGFLGMLLLVAASVPAILIVMLTTLLRSHALLTPMLILGWLGVAMVVNRVLAGVVAAVFDRRRENLAQVVLAARTEKGSAF